MRIIDKHPQSASCPWHRARSGAFAN